MLYLSNLDTNGCITTSSRLSEKPAHDLPLLHHTGADAAFLRLLRGGQPRSQRDQTARPRLKANDPVQPHPEPQPVACRRHGPTAQVKNIWCFRLRWNRLDIIIWTSTTSRKDEQLAELNEESPWNDANCCGWSSKRRQKTTPKVSKVDCSFGVENVYCWASKTGKRHRLRKYEDY